MGAHSSSEFVHMSMGHSERCVHVVVAHVCVHIGIKYTHTRVHVSMDVLCKCREDVCSVISLSDDSSVNPQRKGFKNQFLVSNY